MLLPDNAYPQDQHTWLETFRTAFPDTNTHYSARLRYNPIIAASNQQAAIWPRHVGAHKSLRNLIDLREEWTDTQGHDDDRYTGFWMISWNQQIGAGDGAWDAWEQPNTYRWAEAVQNEITAGGEAIQDVWLDGSDDVITSKIISVAESTKPNETQGFQIAYQIAPTVMIGSYTIGTVPPMGHRPQWHIDINMMSDGTPDTLVRMITEHESATDAAAAPHGVYSGVATTQGSGKLVGSAAYWDGLWDRTGASDGTDAPARVGPIPSGDYYRATLVLDDEELDAAGQYVDFVKTLPPPV